MVMDKMVKLGAEEEPHQGPSPHCQNTPELPTHNTRSRLGIPTQPSPDFHIRPGITIREEEGPNCDHIKWSVGCQEEWLCFNTTPDHTYTNVSPKHKIPRPLTPINSNTQYVNTPSNKNNLPSIESPVNPRSNKNTPLSKLPPQHTQATKNIPTCVTRIPPNTYTSKLTPNTTTKEAIPVNTPHTPTIPTRNVIPSNKNTPALHPSAKKGINTQDNTPTPNPLTPVPHTPPCPGPEIPLPPSHEHPPHGPLWVILEKTKVRYLTRRHKFHSKNL